QPDAGGCSWARLSERGSCWAAICCGSWSSRPRSLAHDVLRHAPQMRPTRGPNEFDDDHAKGTLSHSSKAGQHTPTRELRYYAERLLQAMIDQHREGNRLVAELLCREVKEVAAMIDLCEGRRPGVAR